MAEEKKSFFKKISDALSNKDEKEEAARAEAKRLAEKQREEIQALQAKKQAELKAAAEKVADLKEDAEAAAKAKAEEAKEKAEDAIKHTQDVIAEAKAKAEEALKNSVLATHTVAGDETLSHIALKYYGHATPPYYKLIYEFNKDVIGENMNIIRGGQVLRIPQLPDELK